MHETQESACECPCWRTLTAALLQSFSRQSPIANMKIFELNAFLSLLLVFLLRFPLFQAAGFAQQLRKCRIDDRANLDFCLLQMITDLRPRFRTGLPEVNVPVLDPMTIPNIDVVESVPLVKITARFLQVVVQGASTFQPVNVHAEPSRELVHLSLVIPELVANGFYDISGNVMLLPIRGNGTFWIVLNGIEAHTTTIIRNENNHLRVLNTAIQFNVRTIRLRLNNLFGGDSLIGETVNRVLNDNSQQLLENVKPRIADRISEAVRKVLNDAFSTLPANSFVD